MHLGKLRQCQSWYRNTESSHESVTYAKEALDCSTALRTMPHNVNDDAITTMFCRTLIDLAQFEQNLAEEIEHEPGLLEAAHLYRRAFRLLDRHPRKNQLISSIAGVRGARKRYEDELRPQRLVVEELGARARARWRQVFAVSLLPAWWERARFSANAPGGRGYHAAAESFAAAATPHSSPTARPLAAFRLLAVLLGIAARVATLEARCCWPHSHPPLTA